MRIKSLAQGENILMLRIEPSTFVSKVDILTTTPIVHKMQQSKFELPVTAIGCTRFSLHSMQSCIGDVNAWRTANMFKLSETKNKLMLVTSKRTKHLHSLPTSIIIGNAQCPFKQSVKNLGFTLDCHLAMYAHVSNIATLNCVVWHLSLDS